MPQKQASDPVLPPHQHMYSLEAASTAQCLYPMALSLGPHAHNFNHSLPPYHYSPCRMHGRTPEATRPLPRPLLPAPTLRCNACSGQAMIRQPALEKQPPRIRT